MSSGYETPDFNIKLWRRNPFKQEFTYTSNGTANDLTGYSIKSEIWNAESTIQYGTFTAEILSPPTAGKMRISLTGTQVLGLPDNAEYDVVLTSESEEINFIRGQVITGNRHTR